MNARKGRVSLVGAGPGDASLITLRGLHRLRRAEVVIYDRLIPPRLLEFAPDRAERIDVGKAPGEHAWEQEQINALLVERGRRGMRVVRLKGGDPFMFGRGGEELTVCVEAGLRCEVVPGVTSALAAPQAVGISVTQRRLADSVAIITGRCAGQSGPPEHDYSALAKIDALIVLMGRSSIRDIALRLIRCGRDPTTPVAAIASATTPRQRHLLGTLGNIADKLDGERLAAPVVIVIGEVARMAERFAAVLPGPSAASAKRKPLSGRRIAITRAASTSDELLRLLRRAGAEVLACPLIRAAFAQDAPAADAALRRMREFDWIAWTSMHGVDGFWRRLERAGLDARALAPVRVAAIGPGTSSALAERGIRADVVPPVYTGARLASALLAAHAARSPSSAPRVLCPRGNLARTELEAILREHGASVEFVEVYQTQLIEPPRAAVDELQSGVDAIVFCSPSAVRQFAALKLPRGEARIACLGPTTARSLSENGIVVDVVPASSDVHALVDALVRTLAPTEIQT